MKLLLTLKDKTLPFSTMKNAFHKLPFLFSSQTLSLLSSLVISTNTLAESNALGFHSLILQISSTSHFDFFTFLQHKSRIQNIQILISTAQVYAIQMHFSTIISFVKKTNMQYTNKSIKDNDVSVEIINLSTLISYSRLSATMYF